jgi:hypothetical protein
MSGEDRSTRCSALAAGIAEWLERGLTLSDEARHFLESTFGCSADEEIADILQDSTHPESESIVELVFSPSFDLRWQIEPLLEGHAFHSDDLECLVEHLSHRLKELPLAVGAGRLQAGVPIAEEAIRRFLVRLQFHVRLDASLAEQIEELFAASQARYYKTLLRQSRCSLDEQRRAFLADFLQRFKEHQDLEGLLRFLLNVLEETPAAEDLEQALIRKRLLLEHTLKRSQQLRQQLKSHAMETLMMQRVSVLHIDEEKVRSELDRIDEICWQMFGHLPPASGPETEVSFSANGQDGTFQQIFNRFSDLD